MFVNVRCHFFVLSAILMLLIGAPSASAATTSASISAAACSDGRGLVEISATGPVTIDNGAGALQNAKPGADGTVTRWIAIPEGASRTVKVLSGTATIIERSFAYRCADAAPNIIAARADSVTGSLALATAPADDGTTTPGPLVLVAAGLLGLLLLTAAFALLRSSGYLRRGRSTTGEPAPTRDTAEASK